MAKSSAYSMVFDMENDLLAIRDFARAISLMSGEVAGDPGHIGSLDRVAHAIIERHESVEKQRQAVCAVLREAEGIA
jgi:hypothetical protein